MSQVWLITGSSRGLGRALVDAALHAGHKLVATARNPAQLAGLRERYGKQVSVAQLDVTDPKAADDAIDVAIKAFGRLDVIVNNAGYGDVSPIEDTSLAEFRAQIETHLFGTINVTKAALPVLRERRAGHIIQLSSIGGRTGPPGRAAYAAAKWGVEGFSEVLAKEVAPLGIKVTIIEPGGFHTDFAGVSTAEREGRFDGVQPGDPAKAAAVIVYVASLDDPPFRLLLGKDAVEHAKRADLARVKGDRRWRALSLSADFAA